MDEIKPMYDVGSRVFISNPLDAFADEDTTVYTIEDVKFVPKYFTHFYRINGRWINESWLEPDIFGPQYLDEEDGEMNKPTKVSEHVALELEQDYELASLFQAIATQDEAEKERSKQRLAEIRAEMEALNC